MMKNKIIYVTIITLIIGGVTGFLGGMQYQKSQVNTAFNNPMQLRGNNTNGNTRIGQNSRTGFTPVSGEIIDLDDVSMTIKLSDGSSKIVLLSDKTSINKSEKVSTTDLKKGEKVSAFGTTNSDGSISAQNVSIGDVMFGERQNLNSQ